MATRYRPPRGRDAMTSPGREAGVVDKKARREAGNYVGINDDDRNRGGIVPPGGVNDSFKGADGERLDQRRRMYLGKQRLGKRWSEIITAVDEGVFTWEEFVETLSASEIARGQLKDKGGRFRGRPPAFLPRAFYDACVKEMMKRGRQEYEKAYLVAIKTMTEISVGDAPGVKPADRLKAAQFIIERLEGKAPEKIEIKMSDPFQDLLEGAVATVAEDKAIANAQDYLDRVAAQEASEDVG